MSELPESIFDVIHDRPNRPKNRAQTIKLYGDPTRGGLYLRVPDPRWEKENIVELHGKTAIPEIPERLYFHTHKLLEPLVRESYRRAHEADPDYVIKVTASYVFRHMRHDPHMPLSVHSFGAAVDIDPDDNSSHSFNAGQTPKPWSDTWKKYWPRGLSQAYVEAWESLGWIWGGRWKGFVDPMHFQYGA